MRRKIAIPKIVMHRLKMPDALPRIRIQRQQAIRKKIVAQSIPAVKIKRRRARRHKHDPPLHIHGHSCPVVRRADRFVRTRRPRVVTKLARLRNRMKIPAHFPRAYIKCANIARRRRQRLRISSARDEQIFVNHHRTRQRHKRIGIFTAQVVAQIDAPIRSKRRDRFSRRRIQRINKIHHADDNPLVSPIRARPVSQPAHRLRPLDPRIEIPNHFPRRRIHRENLLRWRQPIQHAIHYNRTRLQPARLPRVISPRHLELRDILPINLLQRRIMRIVRLPAIHRPIPITASLVRSESCRRFSCTEKDGSG